MRETGRAERSVKDTVWWEGWAGKGRPRCLQLQIGGVRCLFQGGAESVVQCGLGRSRAETLIVREGRRRREERVGGRKRSLSLLLASKFPEAKLVRSCIPRVLTVCLTQVMGLANTWVKWMSEELKSGAGSGQRGRAVCPGHLWRSLARAVREAGPYALRLGCRRAQWWGLWSGLPWGWIRSCMRQSFIKSKHYVCY